MPEKDYVNLENKKLREYIELIKAELELSQRVAEIKQNFVNS
ncbi:MULTISPECIES: hypothetical protein [Nitrosopumilus]|uniref:Uncharacterized protein n=1 Tax=Nitrosopumilus piranensis TaxID=1582439 RepID=A0A0C5BXE4_9ARCH|nr:MULTISPECIES: hypothetical protein [Nitrosopumilus]AJM92944.1 hypothetical protein NPIRD3C_1732 [Nitrosopumilus piranensis]